MRRRAPEAGSTGGNNHGTAETWACLLLLKIGSAGFREAAWRCGVKGWVAARSGRPASPRGLPSRGLGASRERVCGAGVPVPVPRGPNSWITVRGLRLPPGSPRSSLWCLARPAEYGLAGLVGWRAWAPSPGLDASCSLLNGQACVASTGRVFRS